MDLVFAAIPLVGATVGFAFAAILLATVVAFPLYAGYYYALPRLILKRMGRSAMRMI